jgi:hypothetical protein
MARRAADSGSGRRDRAFGDPLQPEAARGREPQDQLRSNDVMNLERTTSVCRLFSMRSPHPGGKRGGVCK